MGKILGSVESESDTEKWAAPNIAIVASGLGMTKIVDWMRYGSGKGFRPHQSNEIAHGDVAPVEGLTGDTTFCLLHAALCQAVHPCVLQQVSKYFHKITRLDTVFEFPGTFERVIKNLSYTSKQWPFVNALVNGRGPFVALNDDQRAMAASLITDTPMIDLLHHVIFRRVALGEPVGNNLIQLVVLKDRSPTRMAELEKLLTTDVDLVAPSGELCAVVKRILHSAKDTTNAKDAVESPEH